MKFVALFSLVVLLFTNGVAVESKDSLDWKTDYEKALKAAKKSNKNVLVYFTGSDWCTPCIQLKKDLFETRDFAEVSKNYVLLYVDYPRNRDLLTADEFEKNKKLISKYNKKGVFPLLVALSPKEKVLDEYSGYSMNGEVQYHLEFLKRNK
ncbi:thioredoxin family protein [Croceivirga sp. JEA036]|uniref:thioredoxin family protein n=1 Tax=Croceivirga sp. JEA036 TaxID=2721162 RepID=UPI00143BD7F8|nr:thioredoxin family protein [Croceivirga sp. JEA036]NJB35498.1 thioredoxin family protein [Croceivirga sp. JEA036]